MLRFVSILLFCIAASGCTEAPEAFLSTPAKVNKAFPPNAEVRAAAEQLRAIVRQDTASLASFEEQYESQLELRALACVQGLPIGRFDSVATVKALPFSRDCLKAQDEKLLQYLGVRQIAVRFSQPPLAAPATPTAGVLQIYSGDAASGGLVAVLQGKHSEFISMEIPSGKKTVNLPALPETSQNVYRSANGRVTAIQMGDTGLTFFDTETRAKLWETQGNNPLLAWMPEISAAWIGDKKMGGVSLADFQTGKIEPLEFGRYSPMWVLPLNGTPARALVGWQKEFTLVGLVRAGEDIEVSYLKDSRIAQAAGEITRPPSLMLGGKSVVFVTSREVVAYDPASGKSALWPVNGLNIAMHGKLGESTLLVDTREPGGADAGSWVLDIEHSSLLPVDSREIRLDVLARFSRDSGAMHLEKRAILGILETGNTLRKHVDNQRDLMMDVDARIREADALTGWRAPPVSPAPSAPAPSPAPAPQPAGPAGLLAGLARNAQIVAVGVYQGEAGTIRATPAGRRIGHVEVRVRPSTRPVFLVLSSYEPVRWSLELDSGAQLAAVVLFGEGASEVVGTKTTRVSIAGNTWAYQRRSPRYDALNLETMRLTGKGIDVFQGRYEGGSFSVGE